jgi:hypothetical protein
MKLVHVFNTYKGFDFRAGFKTPTAMIEYLKRSIQIHKEIGFFVEIYTDEAGCHFLAKNGIYCTRIVEFHVYDHDRYFNASKFQVHCLQDTEYIMCDIDATIFEPIDFKTDIITEMYRIPEVFNYKNFYNLKPVKQLICSGILGFKSIEFAHRYAKLALKLISECKPKQVTYDHLWHVEELLLTNMVNEEKLTVSELQKDSYEHLQIMK